MRRHLCLENTHDIQQVGKLLAAKSQLIDLSHQRVGRFQRGPIFRIYLLWVQTLSIQDLTALPAKAREIL